MIARAEAACERYRKALEREGINTLAKFGRRQRLAMMEGTLARLKAQRAAQGDEASP